MATDSKMQPLQVLAVVLLICGAVDAANPQHFWDRKLTPYEKQAEQQAIERLGGNKPIDPEKCVSHAIFDDCSLSSFSPRDLEPDQLMHTTYATGLIPPQPLRLQYSASTAWRDCTDRHRSAAWTKCKAALKNLVEKTRASTPGGLVPKSFCKQMAKEYEPAVKTVLAAQLEEVKKECPAPALMKQMEGLAAKAQTLCATVARFGTKVKQIIQASTLNNERSPEKARTEYYKVVKSVQDASNELLGDLGSGIYISDTRKVSGAFHPMTGVNRDNLAGKEMTAVIDGANNLLKKAKDALPSNELTSFMLKPSKADLMFLGTWAKVTGYPSIDAFMARWQGEFKCADTLFVIQP